MKSFKLTFILVLVGVLSLSSCTQDLVDFTVISSKNVSLKFDAADGKDTKGQSMMVFAIGTSIKKALDDALKRAGRGYDILLDGRIRAKNYSAFWAGYVVEGTAYQSSTLKAELGEEGFKEWCDNHNVFDYEKEAAALESAMNN